MARSSIVPRIHRAPGDVDLVETPISDASTPGETRVPESVGHRAGRPAVRPGARRRGTGSGDSRLPETGRGHPLSRMSHETLSAHAGKLVVTPVGRGSPDPAHRRTGGLPALPTTSFPTGATRS